MKIASWNVNSLNARMGHLADWLRAFEPDVVALQETKVEDQRFPRLEIEDLGYECVFIGQKSYNGVAILSRTGLSEVTSSIPELDDPLHRRVIAATVNGVRIVDVYVVNGQALGTDKFAFKLAWLSKLRAWLRSELERYPALVVLGDFNIAPEDRDVYDPAAWAGQILCSSEERSELAQIQALGLYDSLRSRETAGGLYSWWDYRQGAFQRNSGLRIDLALVSSALRERVRAAGIDTSTRGWDHPSDHAPVWLELAT